MYKLKKYKVARRLGAHLFEKTSTEKFALRAERYVGKTNRKHGRTLTDYGKQMLEKQRVRMLYGIRERQFANYVTAIISSHSQNQTERLFSVLERRLDNVVYRMGFASTRQAARQMVSHGHIRANGDRVTAPSYTVKKDTIISVRPGSTSKPLFAGLAEKRKDFTPPTWLTVDFGTLTGTVIDEPKETGMVMIDLTQVLEFYKR